MLRPFLVAITLALGAMPGTASAWLADNGLIVEPTGSSTFDIPFRGLSGARDFWCAAGDYVRRELHLSGTTRIYRTSSTPRRSGQGIRFSLTSEGAKPSGLAILGGQRGISAVHAQSLCREGRERF